MLPKFKHMFSRRNYIPNKKYMGFLLDQPVTKKQILNTFPNVLLVASQCWKFLSTFIKII